MNRLIAEKRARLILELLGKEASAMEETVTITCPVCGHTETMSAYQAEKYEVANDQICEDCFEKLKGGEVMEGKKEAARAAIIAVIEANGLTFGEAHEVIHELDHEVWKAAFKSAFSGQFVVEQISETRQQSL